MKVLLVGNHTCGNRGDAAILRGLLSDLRSSAPNLQIDAITRYPVSSSFLLGETLQTDLLERYHKQRKSRLDSIWKRFSPKLIPHLLHLAVQGKWKGKLPEHIEQQLERLKEYDAVIQVGGSFFVDLYGEAQFEHALCTLLAGKPLYLLGHSVGPFQKRSFNLIAKTVFAKANMISLRESVSLSLMQEANMPIKNVYKGADTAWLVNPTPVDIPLALFQYVNSNPTVAITLRELAPFDKRLGVTQKDYEKAFANVVDNIVKLGYQVLFCSTCTGIDSYHKDDRMVALNVINNVLAKESCHVVMDELNDVELGTLLSYCKLTIGTRLHSAIISMNFNTPAIALNYEHKSEGIMQQLALPDYSKAITSLFDGSLDTSIATLLESDEMLPLISEHVQSERERAHKMVEDMLSSVEIK
ncbi:colanic acid biosynthesis pyruvyl transferase WcaK [Psychromonas sp. PT13]|uniref:colanic acid biosynthesis pyruvyl transferase WcaK n=1 Tax=Psychromonas sp. PT13 TaxID=3439547 RepID=UPI003EC0FDC3